LNLITETKKRNNELSNKIFYISHLNFQKWKKKKIYPEHPLE